MQETENYVWYTHSSFLLGKGATGKVFKGYNKQTGEYVAIKKFGKTMMKKHVNAEIQAYMKIGNHVNVVQFYGTETLLEDGERIMAMEICTEGSLLDVIRKPENKFGLSQDEFLIFLKDLKGGIEHLRKRNLIHRDLKPGNIMKTKSIDGQTIYKLVDLGTARELGDYGNYETICGTEDYIPPELYINFFNAVEQGVNVHPEEVKANAELWSIAVTIYQVATGSLPYRALGGKRNKKINLEMRTTKPTNAISAVQTEEGEIEWFSELPIYCQLSKGLQKLVTRLISGLMQKPEDRWSFEQFFEEVHIILNKKVIHCFSMNELSITEIFVDSKDTFEKFEFYVEEETKIPIKNQRMIFNYDILEERLTKKVLISEVVETTVNKPITLYNIKSIDKDIKLPPGYDVTDMFYDKAFFKMDEFSKSASEKCIEGAEIHRRIVKYLNIANCIQNGVDQLIIRPKNMLAILNNKVDFIQNLYSILQTDVTELIDNLTTGENQILELNDIRNRILVDNKFESLKNFIRIEMQTELEKLREKFNTIQSFYKSERSILSQSSAKARADCLLENMNLSLAVIKQQIGDKAPLEVKQFEMKKLNLTDSRLKSLLCNEVVPNVLRLGETCLADWFKEFNNLRMKLIISKEELTKHEKLISEIREQFSNEIRKYAKLQNVKI